MWHLLFVKLDDTEDVIDALHEILFVAEFLLLLFIDLLSGSHLVLDLGNHLQLLAFVSHILVKLLGEWVGLNQGLCENLFDLLLHFELLEIPLRKNDLN